MGVPDGRGPVIGRTRLAALAAVLVLSSTGLACGGDDQVAQTVSTGATAPAGAPPTAPVTTPIPTAPPATSAPTAPAAPGTPTATTGAPTGGTTAPAESAPGGAGDEEAIRTPAAFVVEGGRVTPAVVTVPAFLAVELRVTSRGAARRVTIPGGSTLDVAAGGTATRRLAGLKPGDYAVQAEGGGAAVLRVTSDSPGP